MLSPSKNPPIPRPLQTHPLHTRIWENTYPLSLLVVIASLPFRSFYPSPSQSQQRAPSASACPVKRSANGFKIWGATKGHNSPKRPSHSRYLSPTLRGAVPFSSRQCAPTSAIAQKPPPSPMFPTARCFPTPHERMPPATRRLHPLVTSLTTARGTPPSLPSRSTATPPFLPFESTSTAPSAECPPLHHCPANS